VKKLIDRFNGNGSNTGGEIFQEKKKRERILLSIFIVVAFGLFNLVLYLLSATV